MINDEVRTFNNPAAKKKVATFLGDRLVLNFHFFFVFSRVYILFAVTKLSMHILVS